MRTCVPIFLLLFASACAHVPATRPAPSGEPATTARAPLPPPPASLEILHRAHGAPVAVRAAPGRVETAVRLPAPVMRPVSRPSAPTRDVRSLFPCTEPTAPPSACDT